MLKGVDRKAHNGEIRAVTVDCLSNYYLYYGVIHLDAKIMPEKIPEKVGIFGIQE